MVLLRFHLTLVYCFGIQSALCPPPPPSPTLGRALPAQRSLLRGTPGPLPAADSALRHFFKALKHRCSRGQGSMEARGRRAKPGVEL